MTKKTVRNSASVARKAAQADAKAREKKAWLKLGGLFGLIAIVFSAFFFLQEMANDKKLANNPYGTDDLQQATIDQLADEYYQQIILPDALEDKIASGEDVFAYFFSPTCVYCKTYTPMLMPIAEDEGIYIDQLNLLEFDVWAQYDVSASPTLIHFKDGEEVKRLIGIQEDEVTRAFLLDEGEGLDAAQDVTTDGEATGSLVTEDEVDATTKPEQIASPKPSSDESGE